MTPVKTLGLFCFNPDQVINHHEGASTFKMHARWAEVKRNDKEFFSYITSVLDLLHGEAEPTRNLKCLMCAFIDKHLAAAKK